jgi:hypothetical protein
MNLNNPLEILFAVILVMGSIWIIEKIITGAFRTIVTAVIIVLILAIYTDYHSGEKFAKKPQFRITVHDLTNYESFKKKFILFKEEAVDDMKKDFLNARKATE